MTTHTPDTVGPNGGKPAGAPKGGSRPPVPFSVYDAAPDLRDALRNLLNVLPTERSDMAWASLSVAEKAARYDTAVEEARAILAKADGTGAPVAAILAVR